MVRNSEGDWMIGSSSLSPPTHPSILGTSPSGVSDLSNEAQGHYGSKGNPNGNLSENSDLGISPPTMAARYYDNNDSSLMNNNHQNSNPSTNPLTSSSSPHLEYPSSIHNSSNSNTPQLGSNNNNNAGMSTDSRPSFNSQRSSIDPTSNPNSSSVPNIIHSPSLADLSNNGSGFTGLTTSGSGFSQNTNPTSTSTMNPNHGNQDEVVPTTFDEGMLRALCDMDCGMPLLYDRIKQSMASAREASSFFKKRAAIEEEYARSMSKLAKSSSEQYGLTDGKAGSFVSSWQSMLRTHEVLGENRLRFAAKLGEMSDELSNLSKEVDKNRKQTRETGLRLEKNLQEAEAGVEKARARFDSTAEDLERLLLVKSGESAKGGELQTGSGPGGKRTLGKAIGKSGLLFKNKNPQQILKQEEEIRSRTSTASDAFRKEVLSTQAMRQEYFNLQLPRILRSLKESAEEIDNGTQYHLARYAFLFESTILGDGMAVTPVGAPENTSGLKNAVENIDNRADFKTFVQNYQVAHGRDYRGPRRDGPYEEGFIPASSSVSKGSASSAPAPSQRPIFGVELATQMARDGVEVPPILEKCASAIESIGLQSMGIYRLSGTTSKVQKLKGKFDFDWNSVDLMNDEAINDINIIAACLKLWLRELPEPLLTHELYQGFIDSAKIENDRLRHIRLHEQVNELPDANYATLKFLMGHLDKVRSEESVNQMSVSNLAIVFGPTLLSPPPNSGDGGAAGPGGVHLQDMSFQCKAVETILEKYKEIFVEE